MLNRLEMLRIFCVAAESSSFKEAANRLHTSPQTVTRAVKELESVMGEMLFHRNTRSVQITAFGEDLLLKARASLAGFDRLFEDPDQDINGRVRITAPHAIGRRFLMPVLQPLLLQYPGLQAELCLEDELTDSVESRIDIGVRAGFIRDRRYIARAVAQIPFYVVGSPELVRKTGVPGSLQALDACPLSALMDRKTGRPWPWQFAENVQFLVRAPAFISDDPETELEAILGGLAYGQLPSYLAVPHIRSGKLISVLPELAPPPWELFVYRPQAGPISSRVRVVYDALVAGLSAPDFMPTA
ncbi:MAG: LysR family transcriptional regulator [Pseudomonas sp.]|nr:LysR family transcriptional regulator [Pseudomonas sp.]